MSISVSDVTDSGSNITREYQDISYPAYADGDMVVVNISSALIGNVALEVTFPAGPNGETIQLVHDSYGTGTATGDTFATVGYWIGDGSHASGTIRTTTNDSQRFTACTYIVADGDFDITTPISAEKSTNGARTGSSPTMSAFSAGAGDAGGLLVGFVAVQIDPITGTPSGWTAISNQDLGWSAEETTLRDDDVTASESISSAAWTIANDAWAVVSYIIRPAESGSVEEASVSSLGIEVTPPVVTATYVQVETASVASLEVTVTPPAVTATSLEVATASVVPLEVTITPPAVTATSVSELTASVASVGMTAVTPAITATSVSIRTASVSPLTVELTSTAVTPTYIQVDTASVAPLETQITSPSTTATYIQVETASVAPLETTLTPPATTATYVQVETASVAPLETTITPTALTATSVSVRTASVAPITAEIIFPTVTSTYVEVGTASVSPLAMELAVSNVTSTEPVPSNVGIFLELGMIQYQIK